MENKELRCVILDQFGELQGKFDKLELVKTDSANFLIKGLLGFSAEYNGTCIEAVFNIEMDVDKKYPAVLPTVREVDNRIPKEFHQFSDGMFCLGIPLEIERKFLTRPRLLYFVEDFVIPYLFSYCSWSKFGVLPFGERSHGGKGIYEYYSEILNLEDPVKIFGLLRILADDDYIGHFKCPCHSGQILRKCHGPALLAVKLEQKIEAFLIEYIQMHEYLIKNNYKIPREYYVCGKGKTLIDKIWALKK